MIHQSLWVILCHFPEKGSQKKQNKKKKKKKKKKKTEEVEEEKQRQRRLSKISNDTKNTYMLPSLTCSSTADPYHYTKFKKKKKIA